MLPITKHAEQLSAKQDELEQARSELDHLQDRNRKQKILIEKNQSRGSSPPSSISSNRRRQLTPEERMARDLARDERRRERRKLLLEQYEQEEAQVKEDLQFQELEIQRLEAQQKVLEAQQKVLEAQQDAITQRRRLRELSQSKNNVESFLEDHLSSQSSDLENESNIFQAEDVSVIEQDAEMQAAYAIGDDTMQLPKSQDARKLAIDRGVPLTRRSSDVLTKPVSSAVRFPSRGMTLSSLTLPQPFSAKSKTDEDPLGRNIGGNESQSKKQSSAEQEKWDRHRTKWQLRHDRQAAEKLQRELDAEDELTKRTTSSRSKNENPDGKLNDISKYLNTSLIPTGTAFENMWDSRHPAERTRQYIAVEEEDVPRIKTSRKMPKSLFPEKTARTFSSGDPQYLKRLSVGFDRDDISDIQVHRTLPSHAHIMLRSTNIQEYVKFFSRWRMYEKENRVKLHVTQVVAEDLVLELMALNNLIEEDFVSLTMADLFVLVASDHKLDSAEEFSENLRMALEDLGELNWEDVRSYDHKQFFIAVLIREQRFNKAYELLQFANPDLNLTIEGEVYGLAAVWHELFQPSYNKYVLSSIKIKPKDSNYDSIQHYIQVYVAVARIHYLKSRQSRKGCLYGNRKTRRDAMIRRHARRSEQHKSVTIEGTKADSPKKKYFFRNKSSVNHISERTNDQGEEDSDNELQEDEKAEPVAADYHTAEDNTDVSEIEAIDELVESADIEDDGIYMAKHLYALSQSVAAQSRTPWPPHCRNYLFTAKCKEGSSCKYAKYHNEMDSLAYLEFFYRYFKENRIPLRKPPDTVKQILPRGAPPPAQRK
jgi:hypothetical protein